MAIRIDLLPRYVGLRRVFKRILLACLALFGAFASVLFLLWYKGEQELETLQKDEETFKRIADEATAAASAAEAKEREAVPYKAIVDFIVDASKTGAERAVLLDQVKDYIYQGAVIASIDLSDGKTAKFSGSVQTIDDYWRFILALRQGSAPNGGPLFTDLPGGPGVPGFPGVITRPEAPQGEPGSLVVQNFPLAVTSAGTLQNPVIVPVEPGAAPAGGPGGPPGGPPGAPPPPPGAPPGR